MARFYRLDVLNQIVETGLIPVFYHPDFETAKQIVHSCSEAGLKAIEFTNRGDLAYRVFADLVSYFQKADPSVMLGIGSIIDPYSASLFIASGANFVVGPSLNREVAKLCNRRKVSYSPGCASASEISDAEEWGVEIIKIFPGDIVGGTKFVNAILGPMPWVRIMPTGGVEVTFESIESWFKAGVASVGIGSNLIRKDWIAAQSWDRITDLANQLQGWIRAVRGQPLFEGIDHACIYPKQVDESKSLANWYQNIFGFSAIENPAAFFLSGGGEGKLEVSKVEGDLKTHIAVRTSDFEKAVRQLQEKGIELEQPTVTPEVKIAFLKTPDPAENRVHIVWRKN